MIERSLSILHLRNSVPVDIHSHKLQESIASCVGIVEFSNGRPTLCHHRHPHHHHHHHHSTTIILATSPVVQKKDSTATSTWTQQIYEHSKMFIAGTFAGICECIVGPPLVRTEPPPSMYIEMIKEQTVQSILPSFPNLWRRTHSRSECRQPQLQMEVPVPVYYKSLHQRSR